MSWSEQPGCVRDTGSLTLANKHQVFGVVFTALCIQIVLHGGLDKHIWDNPPSQAALGGLVSVIEPSTTPSYLTDTQIAWVIEIFFVLSTVCTKLSILVFHKRLMTRSSHKWMQWAIHGAMILTMLYLIGAFVFLTAACQPTNAQWLSMDLNYKQPYTCVYRGIVDPLFGLVSTFSDIWAIVLPQLLLRKLQINLRQKIILAVVFSCGIW